MSGSRAFERPDWMTNELLNELDRLDSQELLSLAGIARDSSDWRWKGWFYGHSPEFRRIVDDEERSSIIASTDPVDHETVPEDAKLVVCKSPRGGEYYGFEWRIGKDSWGKMYLETISQPDLEDDVTE
jgi:hypothetical protein